MFCISLRYVLENKLKMNMNTKLLLVTISSVIFVGCNSIPVIENKQIYASDTLTTDIKLPTIMKLKGNTLLLVDLFSDNNIIKLYDIESNKLSMQFAQKGHGPGEFLHIGSADFTILNDTLMLDVFDPVKKVLTSYSYDALLTGNFEGKMYDLKQYSDDNYTEVLRIDGGYLATGIFSKGKYAILDDSFRHSKFQGSYLPNASGKTNIVKHAIANNGNTVFSQDRKHFVEVTYMASVLSFYDIQDLTIHKTTEHTLIPLNYKVENDEIINNEVEGYLSASYGKKHIYALYCGVSDSGGIATYGKEVHVFSLTGALEKILLLDCSAFQICVNDKENKLFILSHDPIPSVLVYNISNIVK